MADLEHLTIDGTRYDIADQDAREQAETNASDIDELKNDLSELENGSIINAGTKLDNGTDLNDVTTYGKYYTTSSTSSTGVVNSPTTARFSLYVFCQSNNCLLQVLTANTDNAAILYAREQASGTFSSWYRFATYSELSELNNTLTQLQSSVSENTSDIEENKTNIEQNTSDITEINSALADKIELQTGSITFSSGDVPASGYVDTTITFPTAFKTSPVVNAMFNGGTSTGYGNCTLMVNNTTTTSFNLRIINASSTTTLQPGVRWTALGQIADSNTTASPSSTDDPDTPTVVDPEGTPVPED